MRSEWTHHGHNWRDRCAQQISICDFPRGWGPGAELQSGDPGFQETLSVETLRLRKIQQPSQVERLLDAYISRSTVLPQGSYQIRDRDAVPSGLQRIVSQVFEQGKVWSCWRTGSSDTWLFTGEMSLELSRKRGTPVLQICLYNKDGALRDSDIWTTDPEGRWQRSGQLG